MEKQKELHSDSMIFKISDDGILEMSLKPFWNGIITLAHAQKDLACIQELSDGKVYPIFVQVPDAVVTKEARDFYSSSPPITLAAALFVANPFQRILGNFFLGLNKVKVPLQLFTSEEKARRWLLMNVELHELNNTLVHET
jgi:hypothetical protein